MLISNTMTTLVAEQTREIGIMRAIGARARQVTFLYARTAAMLGAIAAVAGLALGIAISNLAAGYFGREFWAVDVRFGVDAGVIAASVLVGLLGPTIAALPAIRRGVRTDLPRALESTGATVGGRGRLDRALQRARFLPRTMQLGLRGVGRGKRRSLATALIVALAVGNLLAVLGLAAAATETTRSSWDDHIEDIRIWTAGSAAFDRRAERAIRSTPGVEEIQPALVTDVELAGEQGVVWGVRRRPLFRHRVSAGRWFTAAEERARDRVLVIERNLARATGTQVGDRVALSTAGGAARFRVIGVADNQQEDGTALFAPLASVRALLREPGATTYWVKTSSPAPALVDRTTTSLEDRLAALGYEIGTEIKYVAKRDEIAANKTVTTSIAVLGFLVVAISMVGLANAMTMSVIERTREIGVLRCIGARARDVRRIFATEAGTLAVAGWLRGVPLGYVLDRALVWLVKDVGEHRPARALPGGQRRARAGRHRRARAGHHRTADPPRRRPTARRRAALRVRESEPRDETHKAGHRADSRRRERSRDGARRPHRAPPTEGAGLEIIGLGKRYGEILALDGCSLTVRPGRVVGLLGPNGAGKTTAMRCIFGLVAPDRGEVRWDGAPIDHAARLRFGYMPEERGLYPHMRVAAQLEYLARLSGLDRRSAAASVHRWLARLGLEQRAESRLDALSHGNQQRVQLAAALVHDPVALVLDEPFAGLDPIGVEALSADDRRSRPGRHGGAVLEPPARPRRGHLPGRRGRRPRARGHAR